MFDSLAGRYDLLNTILSAGTDRLWRHETARALAIQPGMRVLDLAAGTGTSSAPLVAAGGFVTALDRSPGMVHHGHQRLPAIDFIVADAERLPFSDATFDVVTISFGLRNVQHPAVGLAEMARVTRPGGRLVVCEFSTPPRRVLRAGYDLWLRHVLPQLARVSPNRGSFDYLVDSILAWPDQQRLARMISDAGWHDVAYRNLTGGVVALHRARR